MEIKQLQKHFQKWLYEHACIYQSLNYSKSFYEMDVFGVTRSLISTEIEIKTSYNDFKADFKKQAKHYLLSEGCNSSIRNIPNKFYYGCIPGIIPLKEVPPYAGLLYCNEDGTIDIIKPCKMLHSEKVHQNILISMLQLNSERDVLGCALLTYKNKKAKDEFKIWHEEQLKLKKNA